MCVCVTWPALFLRISCYDHQICITAWQVELHLWASECRVCNSVRPDLLCSSELGMWWPARWHLQPQICVRVCVCVCVCLEMEIHLIFKRYPHFFSPSSFSHPLQLPPFPFVSPSSVSLHTGGHTSWHRCKASAPPHPFILLAFMPAWDYFRSHCVREIL